jgi:NitT/TauT family transport system substrate-binding protein
VHFSTILKRHRAWRRLGWVLALAIVAGGRADLRAADLVNVRVGLPQSASDAPIFIAEKKGYFEQVGIKVETTFIQDMIGPLGRGQLEVGATSTSAGLFNAIARGIDIKIVADKGSTPPGYGYQPILARKDLVDSGAVKKVADLKGRKIALFYKGTAASSTLNEALVQAGLNLDSVEIVYMPFPQHVVALTNKAVDASVTTEPSASEAIIMGSAVRLIGDDVVYPNHQLAILMFGGEFIKNSPDLARAFMKAYIRAVRDYNFALKDGRLAGPNAEEIISILTQQTTIKDPNTFRRITPNGVDPNGRLNIQSLEKDLKFYKDQGLIEGRVSVADAVDTSFVEAAVKELGPYQVQKQ